MYIQQFCLHLSTANVKVGVFVRPQRQKIIECKEFHKKGSLRRRKQRGADLSSWFGESTILENTRDPYWDSSKELEQNWLQENSQSIFLTLIWINSRKTWNVLRGARWMLPPGSIRRAPLSTFHGGVIVKAIYNISINHEKLLTSKFVVVFLVWFANKEVLHLNDMSFFPIFCEGKCSYSPDFLMSIGKFQKYNCSPQKQRLKKILHAFKA